MSAQPQLAGPGTTEPVLLDEKLALSRVELNLMIPHDLIYFRGHFPNFPILPGTVQIEWAMEYARRYFDLASASVGTLQVKFRRPISPGNRVWLMIEHRVIRHQITFTYGRREGVASSGCIGLELGHA